MNSYKNHSGRPLTFGQRFIGQLDNVEVWVTPDQWEFGDAFLQSRGVVITDDSPTAQEIADAAAEEQDTQKLDQLSEGVRSFAFESNNYDYAPQDIKKVSSLRVLYGVEQDPLASDTIRFTSGDEIAITPANVDNVLLAIQTQERSEMATFLA